MIAEYASKKLLPMRVKKQSDTFDDGRICKQKTPSYAGQETK
jgi:hypothetical protein